MRILAIAPSFPHPNHPFAGIFTARIVSTIHQLGHDVEVLCPRPFVPPGFGKLGQWRQYAGIPRNSNWNGVAVHRPNTIVVPKLFQAFWKDRGAWLIARRFVRSLHRRSPIDLVFGFDLGGTGGLCWRIGEDLGIASAGWAYGSEVRLRPTSDVGRSVTAAINRLGTVFYQSSELRDCASEMVGRDLSSDREQLRHVVLPHGIVLDDASAVISRDHLRDSWGIDSTVPVILSIGRVVKEKGVFELLAAFEDACRADPLLRLVVIGAMPPRDDSALLRTLADERGIGRRVSILPPIPPDDVPATLAAADIFAFTSHAEGMPNVVLEAMLTGVPVVAFLLPPLREADPDGESLLLVPVGESKNLADAFVRLLRGPDERNRRVVAGKRIVRSQFDIAVNIRRALDGLGTPTVGRFWTGDSL